MESIVLIALLLQFNNHSTEFNIAQVKIETSTAENAILWTGFRMAYSEQLLRTLPYNNQK